MNYDPKEHYQKVSRVLLRILFLNWGVAVAKILYGLFIHCISITADGLHSLSDGAANIIGLIGINIACQPKDREHPYGHKKYETFFSLVMGAVLFFICFNLLKEGIKRLYHPVTPLIDLQSFLIMLITLAINIGAMRYEYKKGRALKSDILVSDSMHTRADIFISLSVIIALVFIKSGFPVLDPIVMIIISLFIAHSGFEIIRESSRVLCDMAPIVDIKKIEDIILGITGVKTCHKIRTRGRIDDIYIDLHVQVKKDMHMDEAHKISYNIEEAVKKGIPGVSDVVVHMEPQEG